MDIEDIFTGLSEDATPLKGIPNPLLLGCGSLVLIGSILYFLIVGQFLKDHKTNKKIIGVCVIVIVTTLSYNMTANRIITTPLMTNVSIDTTRPEISIICNYILMMARILIICLLAYYIIILIKVILEPMFKPLYGIFNLDEIWPPFIINFSESSTWIIHGSAFVIGFIAVIVAYYIEVNTKKVDAQVAIINTRYKNVVEEEGRGVVEEEAANSSCGSLQTDPVEIQILTAKSILMSFAVVLSFYVIVHFLE